MNNLTYILVLLYHSMTIHVHVGYFYLYPMKTSKLGGLRTISTFWIGSRMKRINRKFIIYIRMSISSTHRERILKDNEIQ